MLRKRVMGYVYVLSNPSMPGIYKIGETERDPPERLKDANKTDTFRPPTPYLLEFARKVDDHKKKEAKIHNILEQLGFRVNNRREFFKVPLEATRELLSLMDGEWWEETEEKVIPKPYKSHHEHQNLKDKQRIRHKIRKRDLAEDDIKVGYYSAMYDAIIDDDGKHHDTISKFALDHIREINPSRMSVIGSSRACEVEVDGKWQYMFENAL